MPDARTMIDVVQAYVAAFETGDSDAIASLYAADATLEDPIGAALLKGREAIRAFYANAIKTTGAKLQLQGPVRVARDYAAFPFLVHAHFDGADRIIEVIDTFRFNDDNQIVEMRAFWGPTNVR